MYQTCNNVTIVFLQNILLGVIFKMLRINYLFWETRQMFTSCPASVVGTDVINEQNYPKAE